MCEEHSFTNSWVNNYSAPGRLSRLDGLNTLKPCLLTLKSAPLVFEDANGSPLNLFGPVPTNQKSAPLHLLVALTQKKKTISSQTCCRFTRSNYKLSYHTPLQLGQEHHSWKLFTFSFNLSVSNSTIIINSVNTTA